MPDAVFKRTDYDSEASLQEAIATYSRQLISQRKLFRTVWTDAGDCEITITGGL